MRAPAAPHERGVSRHGECTDLMRIKLCRAVAAQHHGVRGAAAGGPAAA